jgi:uncharacterized protein (DUF849 family)
MASAAKRGPVIIEAAINGNTTKSVNPAVPRSPAEIAECALECLDRGAAIVHNHNDEPNVGGPARHDPAPYQEAWSEVLALHPRALLHPTVRGGDDESSIEDRYSHVLALHDAGMLPMASADPGIVSIGPFVYGNSPTDTSYMFEWVRKMDVPVHVSVFEPGFLRAVLAHQRAGTLPRQVKVQLYFGDRVPFGLPPTRPSLDAYLALLDGSGLEWMVGVMGGDVLASGMAAWAIEAGGHVRVGLEDLYDRHANPSNQDLVVDAVELVGSLGCEVATCEQARSILHG